VEELNSWNGPVPGLESIVAAVASSKKYRSVCQATVRRLAARELAHQGDVQAALKATKRRLHQVYAAFEVGIDFEAEYRRLEAAYQTGADDEIRATCQRLLGLHSSTRERLPILSRFYEGIFAITGQPASVLDLGCGLNPLALPWMGLSAGTPYVALDIDADRICFLNRYLALAGRAPSARCQDILSQPPGDAADLAFLLKMSPTLERQEPGSTQRLVEGLRVARVVVSFAVRSLGGQERGMRNHYQHRFQEMAATRGWLVRALPFATELAFVVEK
jgi:16S rRNA (guanine(1405)-N(7))-methyltransferase